jgi:hypothetical protein
LQAADSAVVVLIMPTKNSRVEQLAAHARR